jgi:hypothetical protein
VQAELPEPSYVAAQRWGRGFAHALPVDELQAPSVRLAAAGDFLRGSPAGAGTGDESPIERAWSSGGKAASLVGKWLQ